MGSFRIPGRVCSVAEWFEMDSGTLALTASPFPGVMGNPSSAQTPAVAKVTKEEQAEYDLLKKYVGVLDERGKAYKDASAYVEHRNRYFGGDVAYAKFATESDEELEKAEWKAGKRTIRLRQLIEINKHPEAQDIFYRWVRKAYFEHLGADVDVPKLIRAGMAPQLIEAIKQVKLAYGKDFKFGGFNPRPVKLNGKYRLGTLSEHGVGLATDIADATNAQIPYSQWMFIQKFTSKTVDRSKSRWQKAPGDMWQDIKDINDLFVKKLAEEVKKVAERRATEAKAETSSPGTPAGPATDPKPVLQPEDEVLGENRELKKWRSGFFTLERDLVVQLHDHGFTWGAIFSNVDLHHFELELPKAS
jgi:hypothetical protein